MELLFFFIFLPFWTTHVNENGLIQGWQTFSIKSQIINILGFSSHMISVATMQLCHCKVKAAIGKQMEGVIQLLSQK